MTTLKKRHRSVIAELEWLIDSPTLCPTAGLTCFREDLGPDDLFSVFVKFESPVEHSGPWLTAKIFALVDVFHERLPPKDGVLVLTAGLQPVALAKVLSECEEEF